MPTWSNTARDYARGSGGKRRGRRERHGPVAGGPGHSIAKLGPDEFELVAQLAETPGEWQDDLRTIYRRRD
jgi:hypothetical protein